MAYRNGNYSAFYVSEPFSDNNLEANSTPDFTYYNMLRMWKGEDNNFPFIDSHNKNYNVRDGSDWEKTLKPRLHDRLNNSKNIILFLNSITANSRALREEIDYGINTDELPVIVVYPEYKNKSDIVDVNGDFKVETTGGLD
ncbi:MAG: TIR domain-containing protein [Clostridiales bacterium]|nr:TIR domain-containing protein [Clostridiales bacterium]